MDDRKLPPLPEPYSRQWINCPFTERLLFTEDQMHAYALAALAAAPAPASVLAYMAVNREGEARFTDNAKAAEELERYGWAITPLSQAPAPAPTPKVGPRLANCTKTLQAAGKAYPRTCAECGLGPCRAQAQGGKP